MRAVFGILGVLITLLIVSVLVRQQLKNSPSLQVPVAPAPVTQNGTETSAVPASGVAAQSSQQIEQQFKQALDKAMQTRPMPDDTP